MQSPVLVLKDSLKRESGSKVHHGNIAASKAVSDIVRTTLGPRSMLKMLLDASGGIVVTNDGNAILRELDIAHPAAKSMIELSRTQDEEVGDGTTSVIVLAGEMLHVAEAFIDNNYHPTVICRAYNKALEDAIAVLDKIAMTIDVKDRATMLGLVKSCIGTKFTGQFGDLIADLAIEATTIVGVDLGQGLREVDIKKYIKVEKVPGGQLEDSKVLKGVMFNKDVVAPGKMRRKIVNPRIILLDCPLEYKKGENQTNAELLKEEDWAVLLKMEEEYIEGLCVQILKFKPDLVITEKGLSDLACHYLSKAGVSAIRRLRKTDNNRIAKACGAVVVNRPDELQESDVGTGAGLFEVKKIGDEFFAFVVDCKEPKACTVLLRGPSKDLLNEVERNLQDAMSVSRNIIKNPKLVPGGGATELTVSATLKQKSSSIEGIEKWPYEAAAIAFEAIPRTLAQNCGVNVIRTMTALQGKHANGENAWIGIDGNSGAITDMKEQKIWDAYNVKAQTFKTAIEASCMLLRIDDIVSGIKKKQAPGAGGAPKPQIETGEDADTEGTYQLTNECNPPPSLVLHFTCFILVSQTHLFFPPFEKMTMAYLLSSSSVSPLNFSHSILCSRSLYSLKHSSLFTLPTPKNQVKPRRRPVTAQSNGSNSADPPDRLISAICYFYPFFDGIQYGKYVITQFSPIQTLIQPLVPAIRVFKSFPFNGFLVFLTLYFVVVRNPNFSRYVRFNTMQAIVLDVLLIFPDLLERSFNPKDGLGLDLLMSLDSTVFLFLLVSLIYGSSSCLFGQVPKLPIVAEAAERQVP